MALELGQGIRALEHEVIYITSLWGDGQFRNQLDAQSFRKRCMRLGFISATFRLDCIKMTADQMFRVPGLWENYRQFLSQENPQHIIHTNWHHLIILFPFLRFQRDWFWLHDVIPDKPQYRRLFRLLSSRLRLFVPVSHAVEESLLKIGIPKERIMVVHNGLKDPAPHTSPRTENKSGIRIGIIGQLGPWKGHQDLLEAFSRIVAHQPMVELHIFGPNQSIFAHEIRKRITELDLDHRVVWHGYVAERAKIYGQLDICVVPSRATEALPTVAIEAAFFSLPVIATRHGGLPEIIEEGVTGFLVDAEQPAQLAARLDELLQDADLRHRMGAAARRRAETHFSRERFVADFLRLLQSPPASAKAA